MKNIKLTEEHKSKLLEMCKLLFPKYTFSFYHTISKANMLVGFLKTNDSDIYDNCDIFIHWFEFCMRYITSKLDNMYFEKIIYLVDPYHPYNKGKNLNYPENWKELWRDRPYEQFNHNCNGEYYKKHPIDYLYKQFKQLTNEKN